MSKHIIVGENNRCLCGIFEGKKLHCADVVKSIEEIKRCGQSWDGGLLARLMETLIVDVDVNQPTQMSKETETKKQGWIAVDLDGTLAQYNGWKGIEHIGPPVELMLKRVKAWLRLGYDVRIFTARVDGGEVALAAGDKNGEAHRNIVAVRGYIEQWCMRHIGQVLPITNVKDYGMIELWDDRSKQVFPNSGESIERQRDEARLDLSRLKADYDLCKSAYDESIKQLDEARKERDESKAIIALINGQRNIMANSVAGFADDGNKELIDAFWSADDEIDKLMKLNQSKIIL